MNKNRRDRSKYRAVEYPVRKRGQGRGRSPKLWAYGYSDLARLLGTTEGALRARVARGRRMGKPLDFGDLGVVCLEWSDIPRCSRCGSRQAKRSTAVCLACVRDVTAI